MGVFNYLGLIYVVLLLIPNIIYMIETRHEEKKKDENKALTILENIGRYGAMIFMIVNIPYLYFNFFFASAGVVYVILNAIFLTLYYAAWIFTKKDTMLHTLSLSILPSLVFLVSGILLLNIPLMVFGVLFSITHIYNSLKNIK